MALWTDCGKSSGAVTGSQLSGDSKVVYQKGGKELPVCAPRRRH
jgi:hypothetical protein